MSRNLLVLVILLVASIDSAQGISCHQCANPETEPLSAYKCSNPFDSKSAQVVTDTRPNAKCYSISNPSSTNGVAERGLAWDCTNGCFWYPETDGTARWHCCCDKDLCNNYHEPMEGFDCYQCDNYNCPNPFNSSDSIVKKVKAPFGYCVTTRYTNTPIGQIVRRDYASQGECESTGCSWRNHHGMNMYRCCSDSNLSNIAPSTLVSIVLIPSMLTIVRVAVKNV